MAAILGLALVFTARSRESSGQEGAPVRHEVFVDASELVGLHPGSKVLADMREAIARVGAGMGEVSTTGVAGWEFGPVPAASEPDEVSRQELEAEIAQAAVSALSQLEAEQRETLRARVRANRVTKMESAASEIGAQAREIRGEAAERLKALAEGIGDDRVNASLRLSSLTAAARSPGTDTDAFNALARQAEAELNRIDDARATDARTIRGEAQSRIDALGSAAASEIDSVLNAYEKGERKRIEDGITAARNEIMLELSAFDDFAAGRELLAGGGWQLRGLSGSVTGSAAQTADRVVGAGGMASARDAIAAIERRIRLDVTRAVRELAAEKGYDVVFSRGRSGIPDKTRMFTELMRERKWVGFGPVFGAASGS